MPGTGAAPTDTARVVVGVSGTLGSLTALRRAAEEARCRGAELWPVLAWEPPGGDLVSRHGPGTTVMVDTWQDLARQRMLTALTDVFGQAGPGLAMRALVARGAPGSALVEIADRESDVLVVGAGRRSLWHRACSRSVSRYCLSHAGCPVLAVPPSPLEAELAAAHRRNVLGLGLDTGCLEHEVFRLAQGRSDS
ncbi:universal stress protein [Streptomyces chiangmaiensis]|uniref:Universal stress protein n=1 Tax=Streptomyces chiangmaiensis TaxID=766497 RepID=A0ABU7FTU5_9ACTN|nr:universal stress protein [Streptomyces chiangmaiensis]MED7827489.1 universal stress protein [Streptomyces chiangmaiensis]